MPLRDIGPMSQLFLPVSMWVVSHLPSVQESQPFLDFSQRELLHVVLLEAVGNLLDWCVVRAGRVQSLLLCHLVDVTPQLHFFLYFFSGFPRDVICIYN